MVNICSLSSAINTKQSKKADHFFVFCVNLRRCSQSMLDTRENWRVFIMLISDQRQEGMHLCYNFDGKRSQSYHLHHISVTLEASLWSPCAHNTELLRPPYSWKWLTKEGWGVIVFFKYKLLNCNCVRSLLLICSHATAKSFDVWINYLCEICIFNLPSC